MNDLISDIGKITTFLLLFLAVFLFTHRSKNKLRNRLFASFLLFTAIDFSGFFLGDILKSYPFLVNLKIASVLLQMPLFYLYVYATCYHNFSFQAKHFIHSLPFFGFLFFFSVAGLSESNFQFFDYVASIQYYGYIIAILYTLYRYKKLSRENYANPGEIYKWLLSTTLLFLIGNSLVKVKNSLADSINEDALNLLNVGVTLFALLVICWFVFMTMRSPHLFSGVNKDLKPIEESAPTEKEEYKEEINRLSTYMETHQPYLEDTLTLQQLAERMNISEKQLSFLINRVVGKHFFDYINDYRITEAKGLLTAQPNLTVQEIMYKVGFNSKSSFYSAFKKETRTTPTEYRKSNS